MISGTIKKHLMKEKTIIVIKGGGNQGKSDTIRRISVELQRAYPSATVQILIDLTDIKALITVGEIRIGIESQGDPNSRLEESMYDFADNHKCDIIVCATRTSGSTVEIVEAVAEEYDYRIIWGTNYRSSDNHDVLNQFSARQIVELTTSVMCLPP
jgi:hypothetical protein